VKIGKSFRIGRKNGFYGRKSGFYKKEPTTFEIGSTEFQ